MKYESVIGLEVHAQLLTKSKAFSSDPSSYGDSPNSNISGITFALPGTMPKLNKEAVSMAIKIGLATGCTIREYNRFARKNYFYADLPKGFQISQHNTPICYDGKLIIDVDGVEKTIGITRIHMEEDSGKSIHDLDPYNSLIDLNRAGIPLVEIVSEPDMRSPDEAYAYLTEVRKLVRYLEICDGNMEEGSLRCDANVSIRPVGQKELGTKVEVKNMNSIRNVKRALQYEIERQIEAVENGEAIFQETRNFDAAKGVTNTMRSKEMAHDYRYFPEPDLPALIVTDEMIAAVEESMPALPRELAGKYMEAFGLNAYDAGVLTEEKEVALFFEEVTGLTREYKTAANLLMGPVKSYLNQHAVTLEDTTMNPVLLAEVVELVTSGKLSNSVATQRIIPELMKKSGTTALELAESMNLIQESDEGFLTMLIDSVLAKFPEKVEEYRNGHKGLLGLFMGEVMKNSKGKADPKETNRLLREKLDA